MAYVVAAPRHVLGGDVGELATLSLTGGAAHPPGYPLYVLYLRLFRYLPAASPAHASALATATIAILSIAALQRACRAWGAGEGATAVASAAYALSPLAWSLGTRAEPCALEALAAAAIIWIAAPRSPLDGARLAAALGLLVGLGLACDPATIALAPLAAWSIARGVKGAASPALAALGAVAGIAAGVAPYACTYAAASRACDPASWSWGGLRDATSFFAFVRGGPPPDTDPSAFEHATALLWRVTSELQGLPLLAVAALVLGARRAPAPSRAALVARLLPAVLLTAAFVVAGPLLAARLDLSLQGIGGAMTERVYLFPMVILAVLGARGLQALLGPLLARDVIGMGATAALLAAGVVIGAPQVRARSRPFVELYVKNTLRAAPRDAVVVGTGEHRFGAFLYARHALGLRTDVTYVSARLLAAPWYRRRVAAELGITLPPPTGDALVDVDVDAMALAVSERTRRPLFLTDGAMAQSLDVHFVTYPVGTLIRVERRSPASEVPDLATQEAVNEALAATFETEPGGPLPPEAGDAWVRDLTRDYARPWLALAAAYARAGDPRRAEANRDRAARLLPPE